MDREIEITSEIKHLIEQSIAIGSDSWFLNAELDYIVSTERQSNEFGLGVRFKDGRTYSITVKQLDDAIVE